MKKGTFRPMVPAFELGSREYRPIPYSTAAGALREFVDLSYDVPVHAAGYFTAGNLESLIIAPRDNVTGVSKLPITIQFLANAEGRLFVSVDQNTKDLPEYFEMVMGGMRYKGFGLCRLTRVYAQPRPEKTVSGALLTRIPEDALGVFGGDPEAVVRDGPYRRGYLFKPTSATGGVYVRSLFEESIVVAYSCLVR
ncbi:MAG: hypothetical protein IBX68_08835 [Dehalococcoidia bacterium]|nr:hypothetical protein [Dehalococcoidia bacterium]